jgi:hypothetical protein
VEVEEFESMSGSRHAVRFLVAIGLLWLCDPSSTHAQAWTTNSLQHRIEAKNAALSGNEPSGSLEGGDDVGSAVPITGLPYSDGGNTCAAADDYDEICPFSGSISGDVVYSYTPAAGSLEFVSIDLCASQYDTKVYVYENAVGNLIACNDDAGCGTTGFMSRLDCVVFSGGNTYYIVVDGYFGDCGEYSIEVFESEGCPTGCGPDCDEWSNDEREPMCGTNYVDTYNGGCNADPPVFQPLIPACVCGTSGTFTIDGLAYRDTDWFEVRPLSSYLWVAFCPSFDAQLMLLDADTGCESPAVLCGPQLVPAGVEWSCVASVTPYQRVWIYVAPARFDGVPCGAFYYLVADDQSDCLIATEPTSWGRVKSLFR